ncbi:hypothetical protein [Treponema sp. R80B11-R83G3]
MKKLVIVLALVAIIATGTAFAGDQDGLGIGAFWSSGGGWGSSGTVGHSGALSLHLPGIPVYWGINFGGFGPFGNTLWLGVSGDFLPVVNNQPLVKNIGLSWFIRLGLYGKIWLGDITGLDFGARLPVGLSWQPIKVFELFLDVAPSIGLYIYDGSFGLGGGWAGELGIRLWF